MNFKESVERMLVENKFKSILDEVLYTSELYTVEERITYIMSHYNLDKEEFEAISELLKSAFEKSEEICFDLRNKNRANYSKFESEFIKIFDDKLSEKSMQFLYNDGMIASK